MIALNQVIEYLHKKVSKVNLNNQKANTGGVLIKTHNGWEEKAEMIILRSFQIIQFWFIRKNSDYPVGEAALTATSMAIGKHVAPLISREPIDLKHQLALGDILIEGFLYHGFAELVAPIKRHESYVIKAAPKWAELEEIPEDLIKHTILGSYPEVPGPVTDKSHKMHQDLFDPEAAYVKAIDKLQTVEWSINTRVLETLKRHPVSVEPEDNDAKEQRRRSKLIERSFITGKAEVLKDWDGFYQTFEVDYRGRMYNTEPFLNFQSSDEAKGLLQFKQYKELTEDGEFWLAVHTAASYNESFNKDEIPVWCEVDYKTYLEEEGLDDISVDKMTLNDRAQWTYQNADRIITWAEEDSVQFGAEKPYIFLACCYEWQEIEAYGPYTSIPVSIDGSNNGWQHLGAISKDPETGKLVGLIPAKIQKDFYVQTAKKLIEITTDEHLLSILKSMPMKHIRKGISKRGSMTRAYSAGANKIGENMYFDCKTEDYHEKYGITQKDCNKFASLLVKAIKEVCPGPLETMKYLQDLAGYQLGKHSLIGPGDVKKYKSLRGKRIELLSIPVAEITEEELDELNTISSTLNEYSYELTYGEGLDKIEWDTPSGFKARYEKFTMVEFKQRATLNGKQIKHVLRTPTDRPDVHGFMCGISPNYIHSMDAAHMALVIAGWEGDFGAVHDSFSSHASEVSELLVKTKEEFIKIYDHPNYFDVIREKLTNNNDDVEQPALGGLDIGDINDSTYFFA